jgi:hypothetical protein
MHRSGGVAQLGEHLLCKQGVIGSIPFTSTNQTFTLHIRCTGKLLMAVCLCDRKIGCRSLTIRRVEISVVGGTFRAADDKLIASPNFNKKLKNGITRILKKSPWAEPRR